MCSFYNYIAYVGNHQKHLDVILDNKLNFNQHIKCAMDKANKGISVLRKLRYYIPRDSLVRIYNSFIRS